MLPGADWGAPNRLAVAVSLRCDGCITVHTEAVRRQGGTDEEIAEALGVAIAVNAGAAMVYSARVMDAVATTPEAWVPALGDAQHGFPYLSGGGRLVIKDTMMLAGAWVIGVDAAKGVLAEITTRSTAATSSFAERAV
jgi:AhpD family alkylhydroperoxidase